MEFWLQHNSDKFQLPVKPSDYTVSVSHKNTVVNVIQVGDVNLIGNTGLPIPVMIFFSIPSRVTPLTILALKQRRR